MAVPLGQICSNQELSGFSVKHIVIYPENPDVLLITAGNSSSDLGAVWRSANAGVTWNKVALDGADWEDIECGAKKTDGKRYCYAVGAGEQYVTERSTRIFFCPTKSSRRAKKGMDSSKKKLTVLSYSAGIPQFPRRPPVSSAE